MKKYQKELKSDNWSRKRDKCVRFEEKEKEKRRFSGDAHAQFAHRHWRGL